jgi:hypothetical protein
VCPRDGAQPPREIELLALLRWFRAVSVSNHQSKE